MNRDLRRSLALRAKLRQAKRNQAAHAPAMHRRPNVTTSNALVQRALRDPHRLAADEVLYLQRIIGNQALVQHLSAHDAEFGHAAETQSGALTVGSVDDPMEREADRVAQQVTGLGDGGQSIQRTATSQQDHGTTALESGAASQIRHPVGSGHPVPEPVRRQVEAATNADLGAARVYQDTRAHGLAEQLNAKAFTHGNKIFLGKEQSAQDVQLMAHELTHTAQQATGRAAGIQRQDDEDKKKRKKQIRKLKRKRRRNRARGAGLQALELLTHAPMHLVDQASILDLHAKDLGRFVTSGKTRKQRSDKKIDQDYRNETKHKIDYSRGKAKRMMGRSGLRAYARGTNWRKVMQRRQDTKLPWQGKYNPFLAIGRGLGRSQIGARDAGDEIKNLRAQDQKVVNDEDMIEEIQPTLDENKLDENKLEDELILDLAELGLDEEGDPL